MVAKNIKILLVVFLALFSAVFFPYFLEGLNLNKKPQDILGISKINKDGSTKILLQSDGKKLFLIKENKKWMVEGYLVSESISNDFFMSLANSSIEKIVSRNLQNHRNFGLDAKNVFKLVIYLNSGQISLNIGNKNSQGDSFYLNKEGEKEVYLLSGGIKDKISVDSSFWREKIITAFNSVDIVKLELTGRQNFLIQKQKDGWQMSGDFQKKIPEADLANLLASLSALSADGFLNLEDIERFDKEDNKYYLRISSSRKILAEFVFLPNEDQYFLTLPQKRSDYYKISSSKLSDLFKLSE